MQQRWGTLYEPFIPSAYWWTSMVLLRRVIFTIGDIVLVILPSFKYMIFAFIHLLSLLMHQIIQPYAFAPNLHWKPPVSLYLQ
jgi:hypothetical protein